MLMHGVREKGVKNDFKVLTCAKWQSCHLLVGKPMEKTRLRADQKFVWGHGDLEMALS